MAQRGQNRHITRSSVHTLSVAVLLTVALIVTAVIPVLTPNFAQAAEDIGGRCVPTEISLGDGEITPHSHEDQGLATWVGRDMYIGQKPTQNQDDPVALNESNNPIGSYAVEAEGLTIVSGKLAMNQMKNSWPKTITRDGSTKIEYPGFRFGYVGFGANHRPPVGSTALVVNNTNSAMTITAPLNKNATTDQAAVGAWNHGGWVGGNYDGELNGAGGTLTGSNPYFNALLAGPVTYWWGNRERQSIVQRQGDWWTNTNNNQINNNDGTSPFFNKENPLSQDINGTNYADYTTTIQNQSDQLKAATVTGEAHPTWEEFNSNPDAYSIKEGTIAREKYNGKYEKPVKIHYSDNNKELKVEFTGTGTQTPAPSMQVFTLDARVLNEAQNKGYTGIAFSFTNIPIVGYYDTAKTKPIYSSIVVNIDTSQTNNIVDFHTGWRFYWENQEIGDGFLEKADDAHNYAYNSASRSIMWNFSDAKKVTIRGGMIKAGSGTWGDSESIAVRTSESDKRGQYITSDDPAAAMLGSIMVPRGSFDDHVTTNGRVWVGEDLMLNSPYQLKASSDDNAADWNGDEKVPTASILDMDLERHNFPWSGSVVSTCATISWKKVDNNGNPIKGTTFDIYQTLEGAQQQTQDALIQTVTDNSLSTGDQDNTPGQFTVSSLTPNANYYVRERATHNPIYALNTNIYLITAGAGNTTTSTITSVYGTTNPEPLTSNTLLSSQGAIINLPSGADIAWAKYNADQSQLLEGSEWELTKPDGSTVPITDAHDPATSITLQRDGSDLDPTIPIDVPLGQSLTLTAKVMPDHAAQSVTWSIPNADDAPYITVNNGIIHVIDIPPDSRTLQVCATPVGAPADPLLQACVQIRPIPMEVTQLDVTPTSLTMELGTRRQLLATTTPSYIRVTYASNNPDIATVDPQYGIVTARTAGTTTIRVTAGTRSVDVPVTVQPIPIHANATTLYMRWADAISGQISMKYSYDKTTWQSVGLIGDCGDWQHFTIPADDEQPVYFYFFHNGRTKYANEQATPEQYRDMYDGNLIFTVPTDGTAYSIDDNGGVTKQTPSGCTQPSQLRSQEKSSLSNAVLRSSASHVHLINDVVPDNSEYSEPVESGIAMQNDGTSKDSYTDADSTPGKFKLLNVPNGTYKLKEIKAPDGYYRDTQEYTITIDGSSSTPVVWSPAPPTKENLPAIANTMNQVEWAKVDAENHTQLLAGSQWMLGRRNADNTYTPVGTVTDCIGDCNTIQSSILDLDPVAGRFRIVGLSVGYYRLLEITAPAGYMQNADIYYYFEITDTAPASWVSITTADGTPLGNRVATYATGRATNPIPNDRQTGTVTWCKVGMLLGADKPNTTCNGLDTSSPQVLAGSAWELTYIEHGHSANEPDYSPLVCTITDRSDTTNSCTRNSETAETPSWLVNNATVTGNFQFGGLPWGSYTLREIKAPDGYTLDSTEHPFIIGPREVPTTHEDGSTTTTTTYNFEANLGAIINTTSVRLPETGGSGTNQFAVLIGFALTTFAMLGLAFLMHRERHAHTKA